MNKNLLSIFLIFLINCNLLEEQEQKYYQHRIDNAKKLISAILYFKESKTNLCFMQIEENLEENDFKISNVTCTPEIENIAIKF